MATRKGFTLIELLVVIAIRKLYWLPIVALLFLNLNGCGGGNGNEGSWDMPIYEPTGVVPMDGNYLFEEAVSNSVMVAEKLSVREDNGKKLIRLAEQYYEPEAEIRGGTFLIVNGKIAPGVGHFPREGYAVSGRFTSKTRAEGVIKLAIYGRITTSASFVANLESQNTRRCLE